LCSAGVCEFDAGDAVVGVVVECACTGPAGVAAFKAAVGDEVCGVGGACEEGGTGEEGERSVGEDV